LGLQVLAVSLALAGRGQAAPATADKFRVSLPEGWHETTPSNLSPVKIDQYARYKDHMTAFQLSVERKRLGGGLMGHAGRVRKSADEQSTLGKRQQTGLVERTVHGHPTVEWEVTGLDGGTGAPLHYRHSTLQCGDSYCNFVFWTHPEHWAAAQAQFDEIIARLARMP